MPLGVNRVRATFNPSGDTDVSALKRTTAIIIDDLEERKQNTNDGEAKRLYALAQTAYEEACMWAVKAITTPES